MVLPFLTSGTGYSAGSTYTGSASAYIVSAASNNAASNSENISLTGSTISSSIVDQAPSGVIHINEPFALEF